MKTSRILNHPILGSLPEQNKVTIHFDQIEYEAYEHETVAAALLANGIRTLRVHEQSGTPRGIYCNIGHCFECRVTIDGKEGQRACLTPVHHGMNIESGQTFPTPFEKEGDHD